MDPIEAFVLGLVQGFTEFFPVSSSGHLSIFQALFGGREEGGLLFEVGLHVATLFAIAFFYRVRIAELIALKEARSRDRTRSEGLHRGAVLESRSRGDRATRDRLHSDEHTMDGA